MLGAVFANGGSGRALSSWSRAETRRRRAAQVGLAVLIALTGGATLVALAGARRSASAYDRLRVETKAMDAAVFGSPAEVRTAVADPRVAAVAPFSIKGMVAVDDPELFPFVAPGDDAIGTTIEVPLILHGRRADPSRADELVLPEAVARRVHKRVGDEMRFLSAKPGSEQSDEPPKPDGPKFVFRVVGISRSAAGIAVRDRDNVQFVYLTRAWVARNGSKVSTLAGGTLVRLRHGFDDFGPWSSAVNPTQDPDSHPTPLFSPAPVEDSISVIVDGLDLFALIAAIVGLVAIAQAIERNVASAQPDLEVLRALGVPRRSRANAIVLAALPGIVAGTVCAVVLAIAWSPFMPIGLARRAEPHKGWSFDGRILGGGALVIALVVIAVTAAVAARATHRIGLRRPPARAMRASAKLPPVAATGLHLATGRGRGREYAASRSAMSGLVVAVAGVIAVSVFASGLHRLITEPARYGVPWDATVFHGSNDITPTSHDLARLKRLAPVDAIAIAHVQLDGLLDGRADGSGFALTRARGRLEPVVRTGRPPATDREIALGLDTAHRLRLHAGDRVKLTGAKGSRTMRVVGEMLAPTVDDPATLASGFLVTAGTSRALGLAANDAFERIVVTFHSGVSRAEGTRALERAGFSVTTPAPPPEVARLRDVESLPRALALILALIGAVVVALALVVSVRLRRRDLALLRVFGFKRVQMTGTVVCEAAVFAAIGIVAGVPLGLAIGRFTWQQIASALGVATDSAIPATSIVLTVVGTAVVAIVAALVPAFRASRLQPAEVLHNE